MGSEQCTIAFLFRCYEEKNGMYDDSATIQTSLHLLRIHTKGTQVKVKTAVLFLKSIQPSNCNEENLSKN